MSSEDKIRTCERRAHEEFERCFRERCFVPDVEKTIWYVTERLYGVAPTTPERRYAALLAGICAEVRRVTKTIGSGKARKLVSEKYNNALFAPVAGAAPLFIHLSDTTLYRALRIWLKNPRAESLIEFASASVQRFRSHT